MSSSERQRGCPALTCACFLSSPEELPVRGRCDEEADGWPRQGVRQTVERTSGAPGDVESLTQQDNDLLVHSLPRYNTVRATFKLINIRQVGGMAKYIIHV